MAQSVAVKFPLHINPIYCSPDVLWFLSAAAGGRMLVCLWVLCNLLFINPSPKNQLSFFV